MSTKKVDPLPLTYPRDAMPNVPHAHRAVHRCGRQCDKLVTDTDRPPNSTAPETIDVQLQNFQSRVWAKVLQESILILGHSRLKVTTRIPFHRNVG